MKSARQLSLPLLTVVFIFATRSQSALGDPSSSEQIELFPLAEMESEISDDLQTSTETGQAQAVLVIRADTILPPVQSPISLPE